MRIAPLQVHWSPGTLLGPSLEVQKELQDQDQNVAPVVQHAL